MSGEPPLMGLPIDVPDDYDDPPRKGWRDRTVGEREAFNEGRSCTVFWCLLTAILSGGLVHLAHRFIA